MRVLVFALVMAIALGTGTVQTVLAGNSTGAWQEKQYKKIDVAAVSKEALSQIKKHYGNYSIKEAYRADDGEYKLILTKDGGELTATFTPTGDLIKIY